MKNNYEENLKKSANRYHCNARNANFIKGLLQFHQYDPERSSTLSWWEDVGFILNDYRVIVKWVHPRHEFLDQMQSEAHKRSVYLYSSSGSFIKNSIPNVTLHIVKHSKRLNALHTIKSCLTSFKVDANWLLHRYLRAN
jgi:hypothetical protein